MDPIKSIGKVLVGSEQRDAIHIAIAPVVAEMTLSPGWHVGLTDDGKATINATAKVGIVDPFLRDIVKEGERFYLFLYPNTVTSLRHEWTHPAFGPSTPPKGTKEESERWLMEYAKKQNCYDEPELAFGRLINGLKTGDLFFHGSNLHGRYDLDNEEELKEHAERYLGIEINFGRFEFSCSC
jgi:hypothetical protein